MLPHVFMTSRARARNLEVSLLSEWLKGELGADVDSADSDRIGDLAAQFANDREAFLAALLEDPALETSLPADTAAEILLIFGRADAEACAAPDPISPAVRQGSLVGPVNGPRMPEVGVGSDDRATPLVCVLPVGMPLTADESASRRFDFQMSISPRGP
ncbi:MAG: hypothetical protein KDD65_05675 [Bacteroidetes bacterium]|nr:hypothetical protein [Bacteroidota bacterium]